MSKAVVAIIGSGPYGLSLAAHLAARNIEHRIFGRPMQFWSQLAEAGGERYLKSYCFGTNISTPTPGFSFADYSAPRGLETFEPCSIGNFADYGHWFQKKNVAWVEPVDVTRVAQQHKGFVIDLADGQSFFAHAVVVATGLSYFAHLPPILASLPPDLVTHTSGIARFTAFKGRDIAVIGAGQSALEAAALLYEADARPQLLVREPSILWQTRVSQSRSLWRRLRSPISGLGTGPKAWGLTHFPGVIHRLSDAWRVNFVKTHLPPEGAWWLRDRVEDRIPIHLGTTVVEAHAVAGRVALRLHTEDRGDQRLVVDHAVVGSGYDVDVERIEFLDSKLRCRIQRLEGAPSLNASFETSVHGLHFIGPTSAMSFGPLFRFVVGAEYTARTVTAHVTSQASL